MRALVFGGDNQFDRGGSLDYTFPIHQKEKECIGIIESLDSCAGPEISPAAAAGRALIHLFIIRNSRSIEQQPM